jgi:hypothetical protein
MTEVETNTGGERGQSALPTTDKVLDICTVRGPSTGEKSHVGQLALGEREA